MSAASASVSAPASDSAPALSLDRVSVRYNNGFVALDEASFSLDSRCICGLVGVNGAGKSTLFNAIMGFGAVNHGQVRIFGLPVSEALKQNLVAYVPQSEEVDWHFPALVEDLVMMGRYGHMGWLKRPRESDHQAVNAALERVGLVELRQRQIGELSGGQKKRAFLARAIAQDSRLILLDEPFTGVDVATEDRIVELMRQLRDEGRVMLVSTHNLGSVPSFCDQVVLINRTVLAAGPTASVYTQANLERAFSGVLRHYVLGGDALHQDHDPRQVTVLTDDERPVVFYDTPSPPRAASSSRSRHDKAGENP